MIFSYLLNMQSHPSWVCGLKLQKKVEGFSGISSHPSWVCGLKPKSRMASQRQRSHTLRGCVD